MMVSIAALWVAIAAMAGVGIVAHAVYVIHARHRHQIDSKPAVSANGSHEHRLWHLVKH